MTNGIAFALLSLFFAGLNDVVFKRYSAKDRSRGMVIFGIGLVWATLQSLTVIESEGADANTMLLIAAGCWVVGGALYARFRERRFRLTGKKAVYHWSPVCWSISS